MKLFLKHILRSVRRAPVQPLLIVLTVTLAVSLSVMAFAMSGMFAAHAAKTSADATALGDVLITMRADSNARILFEEDAKALLGEDGRVLGEFRLTATCGERVLTVSCTDLPAADDFYRFSYTVYGSFHEKDLDRTAIVSARAAREQGLAVGDTFTLRLLEQEFAYTVGAIAADEGLLAQSDVLVSIDGIMATLADRMPIISSLGDSFRPYTRLMIKLAPGVGADTVLSRFSASPAFADKQISFTQNQAYGDYWITMQQVFLWTTLGLMLILVAFLVGTSLTLLHRRRASEYALFAMAGASARHLRALVLAESALYALAGGLCGVPLGIPVTRMVGSFYEWQTTPLRVGAGAALFGFFFGFVMMLLCTLRYLSRNAQPDLSRERGEACEPRERPTRADWLPATCILVLSLLLLLLLPVRFRFVVAITAALALVWLLFVLLPLILRLATGRAAGAAARARRPFAPLWLALKNLSERFSLRHAGRLLAVMLALLLSLLACERVLSGQLSIMTVEQAEGLVGYGVSDQTEAALSADPTIKGVMRFDFRKGCSVGGHAGASAIALSGDVEKCVQGALLPAQLPQAGEVVLAKGLATLAGASVGDTVDCVIGGVSCSLHVIGIIRSNANVLYYDAAALGIRCETLCVVPWESTPESLERVRAMIESDGAAVVEGGSLFGAAPSSMSGHVRFLRVTLLLSLALCLLGVTNLLVQQRDVREHERGLLALCGMTRRGVRAMQLCETVCLLLISGVLALLSAGAICLLIDAGLRSFGMLLFV